MPLRSRSYASLPRARVVEVVRSSLPGGVNVLLILQPRSRGLPLLPQTRGDDIGWVVRTVLIGVTGLILAPQMGATGVAIAQLIGSALALVVVSSLVAGLFRSATAVDD